MHVAKDGPTLIALSTGRWQIPEVQIWQGLDFVCHTGGFENVHE